MSDRAGLWPAVAHAMRRRHARWCGFPANVARTESAVACTDSLALPVGCWWLRSGGRWRVAVACATLVMLACWGLSLASTARADTSLGQSIVNEAANWSGTQYCWDGGNQNGPTRGIADPTDGGYTCASGTTGFDCTGLTLYAVYQATGGQVLLSHDPEQATSDPSVSRQTITNPADLEPGDIVYFGGTLDDNVHAGVYAGVINGKPSFWSAVTEGIGVALETMAWEEAANAFVGAIRFSTTTPPGDGSFVSYDGNVYRVAGGAPLYVSNWSAVGGPQPTQALTAAQWSALSSVPANGTLISSTATGMVYEIAGGAPLYVSNFAAIGGARAVVGVDQWDLDNITNPMAHLNAVPANGTLIGASAGGPFGGDVFVIAGGAPLYVSNWAAIGGPQPVVGIDEWDVENITNPAAHLNAVPANGTLISSTATGMVYEIAGGAPLYVSNFAAIGGARAVVGVDQWDLDNITNPMAHLNAVPANGTLIGASAGGPFGGDVFVIAGGAPLYVSNWAAIGGPQPVVGIDEWDVENITNPAAHLNAVPANGTFINTSTGHVYRIAGGAPFAVSSWSVFGGEQPYVTVDEWVIDNASNAAAHLNQMPTDGTVVEGLPSGTYWSFSGGYRRPSGADPAAVGVDDGGLGAFPQPPPPGGGSSGGAQSGGNESAAGGTSNGSPGTGGTGSRAVTCVGAEAQGHELEAG